MNRIPIPRAVPPCRPTGRLAAWPQEYYRCDCGQPVRMVRQAPGVNDWTFETPGGERVRDDTPAVLRDPVLWAELRARVGAGDEIAAQTYSSLVTHLDLAWIPWRHAHRGAVRVAPRPDRQPPWCCGSPMWAAPDGWVCRVTRRVCAYLHAAEEGTIVQG